MAKENTLATELVGITKFGGAFQYSPLNGCTGPNPATGGCSCPAGTGEYYLASVVDGGFWSNQHPYVMMCY